MLVLLASLADDVLAVPVITSTVVAVVILDKLVCAVNGATRAPAFAFALEPADFAMSTSTSVSAMLVSPASHAVL